MLIVALFRVFCTMIAVSNCCLAVVVLSYRSLSLSPFVALFYLGSPRCRHLVWIVALESSALIVLCVIVALFPLLSHSFRSSLDKAFLAPFTGFVSHVFNTLLSPDCMARSVKKGHPPAPTHPSRTLSFAAVLIFRKANSTRTPSEQLDGPQFALGGPRDH